MVLGAAPSIAVAVVLAVELLEGAYLWQPDVLIGHGSNGLSKI